QDFMAADVKVYQTIISIDEKEVFKGLKPGMSAEIKILVDRVPEPVLTVPVQAIVGSVDRGKQRVCWVLNDDDQPEERDIVVGLSNDKMAEIKSGLMEGDRVVLNPASLGETSQSRGGDKDGDKSKFGKGKKVGPKNGNGVTGPNGKPLGAPGAPGA